MAEPGDHDPDKPVDEDLDAAVGFSTPDSLAAVTREPEPEPVSEPAPEPEPEPGPEPVAGPAPAWREQVRQAEADLAPPPRRAVRGAPREGGMGLYAVYVLILFAVPTFGASALLGLLAMMGREPPSGEPERSHFIFQRRTLVIAAMIALMGVILIVVGLGVFVLFALAVWTVLRGAYGVLRLKADQPIERPRHWLF